jgi:hypothetical protein
MKTIMGSVAVGTASARRAALIMALLAPSVAACIEAGPVDTEDGDVAEAQANLSGAGGFGGSSSGVTSSSTGFGGSTGFAVSSSSGFGTTSAVSSGVTTSGVSSGVFAVSSGVTTSSVSVGVGGSSGSGGGGGGAGGGGAVPVGLWLFDDCSPASTDLLDSSGLGSTATRSPTTTCAPGIDGLGVAFDNKKDIVTIPNGPAITFGATMTVAAWVHPSKVSGTQTILDKQTSGQLGFSLGIKGGKVQFSVARAGKSTITSSFPVSANAWTHVAGVYDGTFVFLFINGQQVGQIFAAGTIRNVNAPIRIGNNVDQDRFFGTIDGVFLSDDPLSENEIASLSCIRRPATFTASPLSSGPVAPGTAVTYDIALTNNDVGACAGSDYFLFGTADPPGLSSFSNPQFFSGVAPAQTVTFGLTVTGSEEADPGVNQVPFSIFDLSNGQVAASGSVGYEVTAPTGCFVRTNRELMIKGLSVVEDPVRTNPGDPASDPRAGVWTFGRLMENMAPTREAAPDMVEQLLNSWLTSRTVNGFTVPARPFLRNLVLDTWPRTPDGKLDLARSPLRLLSIVNRIDVRDLAHGHAGEGRFVFGVLDAQGNPLQFTLILEYHLPAATQADVLGWANDWHALGSLPFPSEQYNAALQAVTTRFSGRNAAPSLVNGSALSQLRTNEIALSSPWELREFTLSQATGFLQESTVKLTPDPSFDGTPTLAAFINANESAILAEQHTVPESFQGSPFLGGAALNDLNAWTAPGVANNEARHHFSLNTCNGCHSAAETGTFFLHVNPRSSANEAQLSGFLTGTTVSDPVTFELRTFNDLARRKDDLTQLVCAPAPAPNGKIAAGTASASRAQFISKGISRVH